MPERLRYCSLSHARLGGEVGLGARFASPGEHPKEGVPPPGDSPRDRVPREGRDVRRGAEFLPAEDEDAVRSFASRALQSRGYTVLTAETGERALAVVEENRDAIDLVLSDVVMPEMDGPTLLRELRRRGIGTKVVFISGYAEDAFEKNLEGQTDFAFLPKPFTLKQLAAKVKEVISGEPDALPAHRRLHG